MSLSWAMTEIRFELELHWSCPHVFFTPCSCSTLTPKDCQYPWNMRGRLFAINHPAMMTWQDHHHRDTCHDLSQSLISTRPAKPPILERHRATRLQTAFFASCCLAEYFQRFLLRTSCGITIEKQKYKVLILLHFAPFQIHWWQDNKTIVVYRKFIEHLGHISTPYFS
jgi:hypothetical protein